MTKYLSDLEIANQATVRPILEIAEEAGIPADAVEPYGHFKAKIDTSKVTTNKEVRLSLLLR